MVTLVEVGIPAGVVVAGCFLTNHIMSKTAKDPLNPDWEYKDIGRTKDGKRKINHRAKHPVKGNVGGGGTIANMSTKEWNEFKKELKNTNLRQAATDSFNASASAIKNI